MSYETNPVKENAIKAFNRFCEWRNSNQKFFKPSVDQKNLENWMPIGEFAFQKKCKPEDIVDYIIKTNPQYFPPLNFFKSKKRIEKAFKMLEVYSYQDKKDLFCEDVEAIIRKSANILDFLKKTYNSYKSVTVADETIPIPAFARIILAYRFNKSIIEKFKIIAKEELEKDFELNQQFNNYLKKHNINLNE